MSARPPQLPTFDELYRQIAALPEHVTGQILRPGVMTTMSRPGVAHQLARGWTLAALALIAGCGGKVVSGPPDGPPEGTCSTANGSLWSCMADDAGAPQDGGAPLLLPPCPSGVGNGSCSGSDTTVDTTNPQAPAHISNGDCLQCWSNGLGTYWSCVSGSWQSEGIYSCP
jgi:hypothetical protein